LKPIRTDPVEIETTHLGTEALEAAIADFDTLRKIVEQFEMFDFEDDGHKLKGNAGYIALKRMAVAEDQVRSVRRSESTAVEGRRGRDALFVGPIRDHLLSFCLSDSSQKRFRNF